MRQRRRQVIATKHRLCRAGPRQGQEQGQVEGAGCSMCPLDCWDSLLLACGSMC
jgi:hypothetical protein